VYLLPVKGSDGVWFKNVLKTPSIRLEGHDVTISLVARPIIDPQRVRQVVDKLRGKYGADDVKTYYWKFNMAIESR
jgi:hypothetical protein